MQSKNVPDVARTLFQVLAMVAMLAASAWILQPFLLAGAWATMIVVATWPLLLRAESLLGGRRGPASRP